MDSFYPRRSKSSPLFASRSGLSFPNYVVVSDWNDLVFTMVETVQNIVLLHVILSDPRRHDSPTKIALRQQGPFFNVSKTFFVKIPYIKNIIRLIIVYILCEFYKLVFRWKNIRKNYFNNPLYIWKLYCCVNSSRLFKLCKTAISLFN